MEDWFAQMAEWSWMPNGFRRPWLLIAECLPLALLLWVWTRRSRAVAIPLDFTGAKRGWTRKIAVNLAESLIPIGFAVAIWLLAGPLELGKPQSQRRLTNILFCVDVSGSMKVPFGGETRYDASMKAINQFIDRRSGDAFGLQFFGNTVVRWTPLTTDPSAIKCALPFMHPDVVPIWMAGTAIGTSMLDARRVLLEQEHGDRMVILVTDGVSPDLMGGNDLEVAQEMVEAQITVYAIHVADGEPPAEVARLTNKTGGDVFAAFDEGGLAQVFEKIDSMRKTEVERTIAEQHDNFRPATLIGLIALVLAVLGSFGLRYTPW